MGCHHTTVESVCLHTIHDEHYQILWAQVRISWRKDILKDVNEVCLVERAFLVVCKMWSLGGFVNQHVAVAVISSFHLYSLWVTNIEAKQSPSKLREPRTE